MDGRVGNGAQEIGAAALTRLDDAERLEVAQHLTNGGAADGERCHQFPLGRQPVPGVSPDL